MSGRRLRRLLLLALAVGIGYWIYLDRPTLTGLIDSITGPLMSSQAAVKSSERNRVVGEATTAITEGTDAAVGTLRQGMTASEVKELLGSPDKIEPELVDGVAQTRWTYAKFKRALVMRDGRVTAIALL
jgi:ClpP class serine protease